MPLGFPSKDWSRGEERESGSVSGLLTGLGSAKGMDMGDVEKSYKGGGRGGTKQLLPSLKTGRQIAGDPTTVRT